MRQLRGSSVLGAALGIGAGGLSYLLLYRLVFQSRTNGIDTMLYARGLYGLARGDTWNTVYNQPTLAIHAHLLQLVLAPLTYLTSSAHVLLIGQTLATAASVAIVADTAYKLARRTNLSTLQATLLSTWATLIICLGTVTWLNPQLFDPRPDTLGVPFILSGVCRALLNDGFDRRCLLAFAVGTLARQDFAFVAASALVLSGQGKTGSLTFPQRVAFASLFVLWPLLYHLGIAHWIGGSRTVTVAMHLGEIEKNSLSTADYAPLTADDRMHLKLRVLMALLLSGGGLALLGWRGLGAAVPGAGFLLLSNWRPDLLLGMHYGMFAGAPLIAASLRGLGRVLQLRASWARVACLSLASVLALSAYRLVSGAPGGNLQDRVAFDMVDKNDHFVFSLFSPVNPEHRRIHARLAQIPSNEPLAVWSAYGAPLADRDIIFPLDRYKQLVQEQDPRAAQITTVVPRAKNVPFMQWLVHERALRLEGYLDLGVEVLSTHRERTNIPWQAFGMMPGESPHCRVPRVTWPEAGLALCAWENKTRGLNVATAVVKRIGPAQTSELRRSSLIALVDQNGKSVPLLVARGIADLSDLPLGRTIAISGERAAKSNSGPVLVDSNGQLVRAIKN